MRNKQKDFPIRSQANLKPRATADNHALRPNGTINTKPQERMGRGDENHVSS
ncbi:small acid-soluble spore protein K [Paraliobacillus salinarum]|uniref:small acid-soluble spore protein K n=1 Tax=Paraliobacillus salinarum TaxID=1158996 RepID=UPI0015F689DF|nr:small acid-soluble spore protein K [Paraliobacillus salinarum]